MLLRGVDVLSRPMLERRRATGILFAMSTLPLAASIVMGTIALVELEAACKLCIGIYGASLLGFLAAGLAYIAARRVDPQPSSSGRPGLAIAVAQLGAFVLLPMGTYVVMMPDYSRFLGTCGGLSDTDDPYGVLVGLGGSGKTEILEVLDPLCPTCRAFEQRFRASGLEEGTHRRILLFPLDDACNPSVTSALHPGACTVSEAVLCAADEGGSSPRQVLDWAFEHQKDLTDTAKADPQRLRDRVLAQFPDLKGCVGSTEVQSKLNKSWRWAVKHSLPVLTPQVYVDGTKLCGEDTDLGLEYMLAGLLARSGKGGAR